MCFVAWVAFTHEHDEGLLGPVIKKAREAVNRAPGQAYLDGFIVLLARTVSSFFIIPLHQPGGVTFVSHSK